MVQVSEFRRQSLLRMRGDLPTAYRRLYYWHRPLRMREDRKRRWRFLRKAEILRR